MVNLQEPFKDICHAWLIFMRCMPSNKENYYVRKSIKLLLFMHDKHLSPDMANIFHLIVFPSAVDCFQHWCEGHQ